MSQFRIGCQCLGVVALAALAGCAGAEEDLDRPTTHPVSGVITLDGEPIEGAQITYHSTAGGDAAHNAFGRSDAEGNYALTTFENKDGAVAGEYIVTVTKYDTPPPPEEPQEVEMDESYVPPSAGGGQEEEPPKNELPPKYSSAQSSDVRVTVKESENDIPLKLSGS